MNGPYFTGEITIFAGTFAPRGWLKCDGSILSISQHTSLFSILGTQYGGNGRTTFAIPNIPPKNGVMYIINIVPTMMR